MPELNATHEPSRRSWVASANVAGADFPIQNLPFGVFRPAKGPARGGVAIGDRIFDIGAVLAMGMFSGAAAEAARAASGVRLNALLALGNGPASALRARISDLLREDGPDRKKVESQGDRLVVPMSAVTMELPVSIASFTDFLTSLHHTRRMSPTGDLPPSFKSLPIAYHSRSSSVRQSGVPVRRPNVQYKAADGAVHFGPEPSQDFELELGCFIGPGNELGSPIAASAAARHIFGYCLVNDWSCRAIQRWESQPLGPFLGKSLQTTVSPWIVTAEAMAPFRTGAHARDAGDAPPAYLHDPADQSEGGLDLQMEALLLTPKRREARLPPARLTLTNFKHSYWTFAQMLVHHASNGCNLQPGDLLGSGTVSGPDEGSRACLAEINARGTQPIELPDGERRLWLEDGDEVIFRARANAAGCVPIGFGECRARVEPAVAWPA